MNNAKVSAVSRLRQATKGISLALLLSLLGGCGTVYKNITQTYVNRQSMDKGQAVHFLNSYPNVTVKEDGIIYNVKIIDKVWNGPTIGYGYGSHYTQYTQYHYEERHVAFADVHKIVQHGVIGFMAKDSYVNVTIFDKNNKQLFTFEFNGTKGPEANSPETILPVMSSLLALCPNVK
jgi:hypothetical protein